MAVTVIALACVLSVPAAAAVLVSVASRREDREWTLAGPAPGPARAAARRIVAFHSEGTDWPAAAGARRTRPASAGHQLRDRRGTLAAHVPPPGSFTDSRPAAAEDASCHG
jgi:hypothetical protein